MTPVYTYSVCSISTDKQDGLTEINYVFHYLRNGEIYETNTIVVGIPTGYCNDDISVDFFFADRTNINKTFHFKQVSDAKKFAKEQCIKYGATGFKINHI